MSAIIAGAMSRRIIDRVISVREAAQLLRISPDRLRSLILRDQDRPVEERLLPSARNMGRDWALLQSDVEEFAEMPRRPGRPRACVICRGTPATREHVWPKWLKKISASEIGNYTMGVATNPENWREWTGAPFEHTSRVLCSRCNHRLSGLEGRIRPIIERLLTPGGTTISPNEQTQLGQWLYKTGLMVATTIDDPATHLPKWHYTGLGDSLDLPPASVVWLGMLDRRVHEGALWVQRFQWRDRELADPIEAEGYILVLGIGEVAAVVGVLDTSQSPDSTPMSPFVLGQLGMGKLLRVWPASQHYGVKWPPPDRMQGEDLRGIADAFARSAGHGHQNEPG